MSRVKKCLTSKDFWVCPKGFVLGTFKDLRINPLKNIHFSDKVGVGGSSPLNPTRQSLKTSDFFCYIPPPSMQSIGNIYVAIRVAPP